MAKHPGFGVQVKINVSSTLTAIAQVKKFKYPDFEKKVVDVTTHDSTGGWAEWLASGKFEMSDAQLTLEWDKTLSTHAAIVTAFSSLAPVDMTFQDKDGTEIVAISAIITKMGRTSEQDGALECDVTIKPTGQPTITP